MAPTGAGTGAPCLGAFAGTGAFAGAGAGAACGLDISEIAASILGAGAPGAGCGAGAKGAGAGCGAGAKGAGAG